MRYLKPHFDKEDFGTLPEEEVQALKHFFCNDILDTIEANEDLDRIKSISHRINREKCKEQCEIYKEKMERCCKNSLRLFDDLPHEA